MSPQPPLGLGSRSLNRASPSTATVFGNRYCLFCVRRVSTWWTFAAGSQFFDLVCIPLKSENIYYLFNYWLTAPCTWNFYRISSIQHYLSEDATKTLIKPFKARLLHLYLPSGWQANHLPFWFLKVQNNTERPPDLLTSLLCFTLFTGFLLQKESATNSLCTLF